MKRFSTIFQAALYCLVLIRLVSPSTALAQQTTLSGINGVTDYAPKAKVFGAQFSMEALLPVVGSSFDPAKTSSELDGSQYADASERSLTVGWDWSQASSWFGYSFTTRAGRYGPGGTWTTFSAPSTHSITSGTTIYLTKDNTTAASFSTDWEVLGQEVKGTSGTLGQSFTVEWGSTRLLALDQQGTKFLEFGVAGYDQWLVSGNGASFSRDLLPRGLALSEHALGFQTNLLLPEKNLCISFKYEPQYLQRGYTQGPVVMVGASWTW